MPRKGAALQQKVPHFDPAPAVMLLRVELEDK